MIRVKLIVFLITHETFVFRDISETHNAIIEVQLAMMNLNGDMLTDLCADWKPCNDAFF